MHDSIWHCSVVTSIAYVRSTCVWFFARAAKSAVSGQLTVPFPINFCVIGINWEDASSLRPALTAANFVLNRSTESEFRTKLLDQWNIIYPTDHWRRGYDATFIFYQVHWLSSDTKIRLSFREESSYRSDSSMWRRNSTHISVVTFWMIDTAMTIKSDRSEKIR